VTVLADLDAFLHEHRYCGEIEEKVEGDRVWMTYVRSDDQSVGE
jgi:hypothetical protein